MTILDAILLGVVQGITEFLPISSSGHLIIAREFFGITDVGGLAFDAALQFATAFAIVAYFHKDVLQLIKDLPSLSRPLSPEARHLVGIGAATLPALVIGFFLEPIMETVFRSALLVSGTLILGSIIMWCAEYALVRKPRIGEMGVWSFLAVGFFQALALVPGMSRSGMTIAGGLFFGFSREEAARFAFLLGIPILLGSGGKKILDIAEGTSNVGALLPLMIGGCVSFSVGVVVIHFLLRYLRTHTLSVFAWYRVFLAALVIALSAF